MEMLPLGDLRAELTLMARWNLGSLERRSELARFVRRDAARLAPELRDPLYERLVGPTSRSSRGFRGASTARLKSPTCTRWRWC